MMGNGLLVRLSLPMTVSDDPIRWANDMNRRELSELTRALPRLLGGR